MNNVTMSAIGIMIITMLSKVLGFIREVVLASAYGTSMYSDVYLVALNIPNVIFDSIALAISTTFIPLYFENDSIGGRSKSLEFTNNIFNITIIISLILTIIGLIFTEPLVRIFAMGFEGNKLQIAIKFTRILMLSMLSIGLSSIIKAYLNAKDIFIIPTLMMSLPFNIIVIISILLSAKTTPYVLAYGTLIAILSKFVFQIPFAYKNEYEYKPHINLKDENIKKIIWLVGPVFIGVAVNQINTMMDRTLASTLVEGSISALNYANRLNNFVMGLVIASIGAVIYPILSRLSAENSKVQFNEIIVKSVNSVVLLVIPISVGAIILSKPIVSILFERGAFDKNASDMTTVALIFYAIGFIGFGLRDILGKVFYSIKDTKTPMVNGVISIIINIALNLILVNKMKHAGLAFATSISSIICIFLLFASLKKKIGYFGQDQIIKTTIKSLIAAFIMGVITIISHKITSSILGNGFINEVASLGISIGIAAISYGFMAILLKINEISIVINSVKKKLKIA